MAFRRKEGNGGTATAVRPVIASAARYTFGGDQTWQKNGLPIGDRRWQIEAWRHYDICGELRYATGWKANAATRAIMYVADVDPDTGEAAGPTENEQMAALGRQIFGQPAQRAKHIRTCELNLQVAGEVYVIVRPQPPVDGVPQPDKWITLSGTELSQQGKSLEFIDPDTGTAQMLSGTDVLIRIYNGHPQIQLAADSPVRALLPTLREIEKASQNIAARLDSRLASAGVLTVPLEADLPRAEGDAEAEETPTLTQQIFESMQASLRDPGSAAAQVPIIFNVPAEAASGFKKIDFESPLNAEIVELRTDARERLAVGLDLPREVIEGMGKSNHWSAWQVADETYRTHIAPDLETIGDALTAAWLVPMAKTLGIPDPTSFMVAFDPGPLVAQPDPIDRVMALYDAGLITADAALRMLNVPEGYAPSPEDKLHRLAVALVTASPVLASDAVIRRLLGIDPAPGAPDVAIPPQQHAPAVEQTNGPPAVTASAGGDFPAADLAVRYALERAGNRLLNTQRLKSDYAAIPRHELHVRLRPDPEQHAALLDGAWRHTPALAARYHLDEYTAGLIATGVPHSNGLLREWMASRG